MKVFLVAASCVAAVTAIGMAPLPSVGGGNAAKAQPEARGGGSTYGGGATVYCPSGSTWGGPGPYCISNNLYWCNSPNSRATMQENCAYGCQQAPPGTPDSCSTGGGSGQCYNDYDCPNGMRCRNGRCQSGGGSGGQCWSNNECPSGQYCNCQNYGRRLFQAEARGGGAGCGSPGYCVSDGSSNRCNSNYDCGSNCCYNGRCESSSMCQGGGSQDCNRYYDCESCLRTNGRCLWDPYQGSGACRRQDQCNYKTSGAQVRGGGGGQSQVCFQYVDQCYSGSCHNNYDRYSCENQPGFDCVWNNGQCGARLDPNYG